MKKTLIISILIITIFALAPRFIGASAEDKIRELYSQANQHPNINFKIDEYNRGWFSSELKVKLQFFSPASPLSKLFELSITHDMQHGPVLWKADGLGIGLVDTIYGIELPQNAQAELEEYKDAVNATSRMSFNGSSISTLEINPFTFKHEESDINVLSGKFETSLDMSGHISFHGDWKGMTIRGKNNTNIQLSDFSLQMDQTSVTGEIFGPRVLFEGDMEMLLKNIQITGSNPVNIENFSIKSVSEVKEDISDYNVSFKLDKLSTIGQEFNDVIYQISVANLSNQALIEMQEIMNEDNSSIDPTQLMQKLQGLLPIFIEKNPVLKIDRLGMNTAKGKIESIATISINQEKYDANNEISLMMAVEAEASGYAPEAFFTDLGLGSEIDMFVQQNLLVREAQQLKFNASFKNGQALINGAPIPLGM